jgi:hypothetical protein
LKDKSANKKTNSKDQKDFPALVEDQKPANKPQQPESVEEVLTRCRKQA